MNTRRPGGATRARATMRGHSFGVALCALCALCAWGSPAGATVPVVDPTNLVQNTTSAIAEVETSLKQAEQLRQQTEQLANQIQDLEKLEIRNLEDLLAAYAKVTRIIDRTVALAAQWRVISDNFARIYGEWGPEIYKGAVFWARRKLWEDNTDMSLRQQLNTQAEVAGAHAELHKQARELERASKDVRGTVASTELTTKTMGVFINQYALGLELELAEGRAAVAAELEARRKAEAARLRQLDVIGRGFGAVVSTASPVELKDF